MARTIISPPPIPAVAFAQPGGEITGEHSEGDRGWSFLAVCLNSAWYHKVGTFVCDIGHSESDNLLSVNSARNLHYRMRTPYEAGQTTYVRIFFDLHRDAASSSWTFDVQSSLDSLGTTQFHGGSGSFDGLWYAGDIEIDDSNDTEDVRVSYISSDTADNYVRGVYLLPYRQDSAWPAGVFDVGFAALETRLAEAGRAASTHFLQEAAAMAQRTYERGVGTLVTSARKYAVTTPGFEFVVTIIPVSAPPGVSEMAVWWYVTATAATKPWRLWWAWADDLTKTYTEINATGWKGQTVTGITPGTTRVLVLGVTAITVESLCVFFEDATL